MKLFKKTARILLWSIVALEVLANVALASWHQGHEVGYINAMGDAFFNVITPEKFLTDAAIKRGYLKEPKRD